LRQSQFRFKTESPGNRINNTAGDACGRSKLERKFRAAAEFLGIRGYNRRNRKERPNSPDAALRGPAGGLHGPRKQPGALLKRCHVPADQSERLRTER